MVAFKSRWNKFMSLTHVIFYLIGFNTKFVVRLHCSVPTAALRRPTYARFQGDYHLNQASSTYLWTQAPLSSLVFQNVGCKKAGRIFASHGAGFEPDRTTSPFALVHQASRTCGMWGKVGRLSYHDTALIQSAKWLCTPGILWFLKLYWRTPEKVDIEISRT